MFKSIKTRLLLFQITLVLFICAAIGVSSYYLMVSSLVKSQQANLRFIASSQADRLNVTINNRSHLLEKLAMEDAVKKYVVSYRELVLIETFVKYKADFPNLAFVDEDGTESLKLINGKGVDTHVNIRKSQIFLDINRQKQKVQTSIPISSNNASAAFMEFGFYRQNFFDEFEGMIVGRVPLGNIFHDIETFKSGESGFLVLINNQGRILACPRHEKAFHQLVLEGEHSKKLLSDVKFMKAGSNRINILGTDAFVAYAPVKGKDWTVLAVLPYQEYMAAPVSLKKFSIFISVVILLISALIALVIANSIAKPIQELTQSAGLIAKGDLSQQVDLQSTREIKNLGQAFNKMTANLQKSQAKLQESQEKLAITLRSIGDAVIVTDNAGNIVMMNPIAEQMTGWIEADAIGKSSKQIFHIVNEDTGLEVESPVDKALKQGIIVGLSNHTILIAKDGSKIAIDDSGAPIIDDTRSIVGVVLVFRDVTMARKAKLALEKARAGLEKSVAERTTALATANERLRLEMEENKRAEEKRAYLEVQLQRVEKMEAIGTLAGGVAHDLNNVLSGIVGYPELLLMDLPEDSPLKVPIVNIKESGIKAAAIVEDLLTMARRGVVIEDVVELNALVTKYLKSPEFNKLLSFNPAVEVKTRLAADILNVAGSPVHLSKTLMNLVSNSAEAMPRGGRITITTENRYVDQPIKGYDSVAEGDYVKLTVSDTGEGILPKDIKRIFEPFYTKKIMGRSGTGLGMAVVYGTIKDHNGYIDVQSTAGEGTTFVLYFPATQRQLANPHTALSIDDYRGSGQSILVVDDVKQQRELAKRLLSALGYKAHSVSGGEAAVEYLKQHSVNLVLLDMIMDPGIDGLDTYKRIIEIHPGQAAIIASGYSETDRVKTAQELGAGQYIKKPYTLEKIGLAIRHVLNPSVKA
jgi:PAS domain S-box-containing protein